MINNATISMQTLNKKGTIDLDSTLMFSFQNTGTATMFVGINEAANSNLSVAAGDYMTFRATKETMYHNQKLNIDFAAAGEKSCRIVLEVLGADITSKVCN